MGIDYGAKFLELRKKNKLSQKDLATIAEIENVFFLLTDFGITRALL